MEYKITKQDGSVASFIVIFSILVYFVGLSLFQGGHSTISSAIVSAWTIIVSEVVLFYLLFSRGRDKKFDDLIEEIKALVREMRQDREEGKRMKT